MKNKNDLLNVYLNEIKKYEPLSNKEQQKLLLEYKSGDKASKEKLIKHNLSLVVKIANKVMVDNNLEKDILCDLIEEGNIGLIKAIEKYEISNKTNLRNLLSEKIKDSLLKYVKNGNEDRVDLSNIIVEDKNSIENIEIYEIIHKAITNHYNKNINPGIKHPEMYIEIFKKYYGFYDCDPKKIKELAEEYNFTPDYIKRIINRHENRIGHILGSYYGIKSDIRSNKNLELFIEEYGLSKQHSSCILEQDVRGRKRVFKK